MARGEGTSGGIPRRKIARAREYLPTMTLTDGGFVRTPAVRKVPEPPVNVAPGANDPHPIVNNPLNLGWGGFPMKKKPRGY